MVTLTDKAVAVIFPCGAVSRENRNFLYLNLDIGFLVGRYWMDNPGRGRADLNLKLVKPTVREPRERAGRMSNSCQTVLIVLITLLLLNTKQIPQTSSHIAQ